jgi:hypothetical protein
VFLLGVSDGVVDDVTDVGVGELVGDLGAPAGGGDEPGVAQHLEVLGQQWLADLPAGELESGLYFVDAARPFGQLDDRGEADRRCQRLEQVRCSAEDVVRLRFDHTRTLAGPYISTGP